MAYLEKVFHPLIEHINSFKQGRTTDVFILLFSSTIAKPENAHKNILIETLLLTISNFPKLIPQLKWNSHQKATKALYVIEYESNLQTLRRKRHF